MIFHPHVHFVVPCGGVSDDGNKWLSTPSNFLFPEAVASPVYRQKFREELRAADLEKNVDPTVWRRWWEVHVKPVSDGRAVLKYLAPYVFRVAISDNRILECTETSVTFKYTPSKSKTTKTRTVEGCQFVVDFCSTRCRRAFAKCVTTAGWRRIRGRRLIASNGWCGCFSAGRIGSAVESLHNRNDASHNAQSVRTAAANFG